MFDVIENGIPQVLYASKTLSADALLGDFCEEPLHLIEPTAVSRNEVQMPTGVLGDPQAHVWCFMRGVIIQDRMDF